MSTIGGETELFWGTGKIAGDPKGWLGRCGITTGSMTAGEMVRLGLLETKESKVEVVVELTDFDGVRGRGSSERE